LSTYFTSSFTIKSCPTIPETPSDLIPDPMPELSFTKEIVLASLDKLDVNKSKGPDGIHPRLLKEYRHVLSSPCADFSSCPYKMQSYHQIGKHPK